MDSHKRGEYSGGKRTEIRKQEEKESIEEVIEQVDEGDLLPVKGVLICFQGAEEEPKEDFLPSKDENTLTPTPLPRSKRPLKTHKRIKSNFSQQGENDGGPSSTSIKELQFSSSNLMSQA